jgi:uncharacterized protein (DUF305 family)
MDLSLLGKRLWSFTITTVISVSAATSANGQAPILQPGAPGEAGRLLTAEEATAIARTGYSVYDVQFMQDMIPHHHQATEMAALVGERTNQPDLIGE